MTDKNETGAVEAVKAANAQTKVDRAKAETEATGKQKAAARKTKATDPVAYTADRDVYVDNRYYKAGEVFVTSQPKGESWTEREPDEVAAIEASVNLVPDDVSLEAASPEALEAVAIMHHVNIAGIAGDKAALITAIKAANDPTR